MFPIMSPDTNQSPARSAMSIRRQSRSSLGVNIALSGGLNVILDVIGRHGDQHDVVPVEASIAHEWFESSA